MASRRPGGEVGLLLGLIDEAYDRPAWHGPNLRGALRGLTAEAAAWRPAPERHSIWEIVVHCAYWKYAVRRRLTGEGARGSFPRAGSNWPRLPAALDRAAWRADLELLDEEHRLLREAVAGFPARRLSERHGKHTAARLIRGIGAHDLYHAGQVRLLIKLAGAKAGRRPD
ncbi:MAG TPA: DinB family protein [Thermoanaerobaculaceae bacterium]|nr:DinB family protein [Thermoanaerobaculaceae bacterium]